ncbi:MAG: HIT family protein, partial [Candidatus Saccharibacteria bacterium]
MTMGEFYYLGNARTQAQHDEMVALEADKLCLFCPEGVAARGKSIIWENDFWIVTDNDYPYPHTLHHL